MKLQISIEYKTAWGEQLVLCLGGKRYPLNYVADGLWCVEIARFNPAKASDYTYEVVRDGETVRKEWKKHDLRLPEGMEPAVLEIVDRWIDRPVDAPFYSSAFTKAIFGRHDAHKKQAKVKDANVLFKVMAPTVRPDEVLALAGSGKALEDWNAVIPFDSSEYPLWTLSLKVTEPFEYKLIIADKETLRTSFLRQDVEGCPYSYPCLLSPQ